MDTKNLGVMLGGVAAVMGLAYARTMMSGSLSEQSSDPNDGYFSKWEVDELVREQSDRDAGRGDYSPYSVLVNRKILSIEPLGDAESPSYYRVRFAVK